MASSNALRASIGGLTTVLRYGPDEVAARARAGLDARFEREVDPDGSMEPAKRARLVELARTRYYRRLAFKSAEVRRNAKTRGARHAAGAAAAQQTQKGGAS